MVMWRQKLAQVSRGLLPGIVVDKDAVFSTTGGDVISSMPLQVALYFNVIFFPFWLAVFVISLAMKYECLTSLERFLTIMVLVGVVCIECLRLYLGYMGNLLEQVADLATFWLLSLLLQLPSQGYLLWRCFIIVIPMEQCAHMVMIILLVAELISGYFILRDLALHIANHFHMLRVFSACPTLPTREKTD